MQSHPTAVDAAPLGHAQPARSVPPLDRASPVPLWAQLRDELTRRVRTGDFVEAFPSETELVQQYRVSRNTVRDALRHLRAEGVVVAGRGLRPRLGSEVEIEQPLGALYSLFHSVEAAGLEQRSVVRALELRTNPTAAAHLGCPSTMQLLYLERLRLAAGEPLALDRAWFPGDIAAPLLEVDFTHTGFYDELANRTGLRLTGGREQLRAVVPERGERALLNLPAGVAAFAIERLGLVKGRSIEWRTTLVRGDRFSVVAAFSGGTGYRLEVHPSALSA